jgi:hypothetical protein
MLYKALDNKKIEYLGNKINSNQIIDFRNIKTNLLENRIKRIKNEETFLHLANIDN